MPTEAELVSARITRIKTLIADLEKECANTAAAAETFRTLKAELDAAHALLKPAD